METTGNAATMEEPALAARRVFSLIGPELALVEAEFERQARSNVQVIGYIGEYLRESGGKRVRPALTLLSARSVGGDAARPNVVRMATVMEFLHTATLVHDDIIDNAETRRNRASINSRFGNQTAVLMGDWLYMSAFETSLQERSLPVLDILTAVTRMMTEGELLQLTMLGSTDLTEEQYFDILRRKTAYLFSACCEIGAILGGGDEHSQRALREYGMNLGTAFQLVDDLLDFTGTDESLGKAAGVDLLEGKVTLPLILLLKKEPAQRAAVQTVMRAGSYDEVPRAALLRAAEGAGSVKQARARAAEFADAARRALEPLPPTPYRQALLSIPNFILEREG
ncbi:MAG TPA: polyprenyl synthetase family protein [Pyrinomonadaceae bacterium]|nr:polyprenyl synthetase family protein [Pyrinomonadaceae bacterium]